MKNLLFFVIVLLFAIPGRAQSVFINEVHYDNAGADVNEGFEIAAKAGMNLFGWRIILYNGSNGEAYASIAIPSVSAVPNQSNGFGFISFTHSGIQNGSPDGFALVTPSDSVVQFLSYEGAITATNGAAKGLISMDIGVSETSTTPVNHSLQLTGYGDDYTEFQWQPSSQSSFGNINLGQTFGEGDAPETYDMTRFKIISNTEIHITFSEKLSIPLVGFNIISTSLTNVSVSVMNDSVVKLTFDSFTPGTSQHIEISKDLENMHGELLAKNISETFLFNNLQPTLVISEIMYNNASANTTQDRLEFIEFYNPSSATIYIGGFKMSSGVEYTFPEGTTLAANSFYVICEDAEEFEIAFGFENTPEWSGSLNNSGETLTVINTENDVVDKVSYKDGGAWPNEADGNGPSLEIIDPSTENNDPTNWRAAEGFAAIYDTDITYASPFALQSKKITPLSILDFSIPNAHTIRIAFSTIIDSTSLNLNAISGLGVGITTSSLMHDSIVFIELATPLEIGHEYSVHISTHFVNDTNGIHLTQSFATSFIFNNSLPDLVITEIMYNLPGNDSGLEFLELYNNEDDTINISGFYFENGVEYHFPEGSTIAPKEFYLLGENGILLSHVFSIPFETWTAQNLKNSGELVSINNASGIEIDRVEYKSSPPWPKEANGKGASLEIINPDANNDFAPNWRASNYYAAQIGENEIFASPGALDIITKSVFYFTQDSVSFFEGETAKIQVHLKHAEKINTRVNLILETSTATENEDFQLFTKKLHYDGTETIFDVEFELKRDYTKENEEFFELKLQSAKHALISPSHSSIKIKIKDTDQGSAEVCINEVNRNKTSLSPAGNYVPFIEITNIDFYSENLERHTLKAESEDTTVFFPLKDFTSVRAGNYLTLWLENSALYSGLRKVMLSDTEIKLSLIKDKILVNNIIVPPLAIDEVFARVTDCASDIEKRNYATPNGSNNTVGIAETPTGSLKVYPNPAKDVVYFNQYGRYSIFNSIGVELKKVVLSKSVNISELPPGVYLIKSTKGIVGRFVKN